MRPEMPEFAVRYRWLLEPTISLVVLGAWIFVSLPSGTLPAAGVAILLTASIAISRVTPGWALAAGGLAVVGQLTVSSADLFSQVWVYPLAGVVVFFAAGAFGNRIVRWLGFSAALVSVWMATAVILIGIGEERPDGLLSFQFLFAFLLVGQLLGVVLVGSWCIGVSLRERSSVPARVASAPQLEAWLIRPEVVATNAHTAATTDVFRRMTPSQIVLDAGIAIAFFLFCTSTQADANPVALVVLLVFSLAVGFRRIAPAVALSLAWVAAILQMTLGLSVLNSDLAVLAVLYTSAAYGKSITRWLGLASAGFGALVGAIYIVILGGTAGFTNSILPDIAFGTARFGQLVVGFAATLVASLGVLGLAWTVGLLVRTWRKAIESRELEKLAIEEQRLAERTVVVEQERNRIARDMHDVVAHSLAVVIAQADGARYVRSSDPAAVDTALTTISATAREALGDVRILLAQLRQDETRGPQPVLADLDRLVEQMRGAGLSIAWTVTGTPRPLGSGAQLAVYRVIQEALTNALRHGDRERKVQLNVNWEHDTIAVGIDNAVRLGAQTAAGADVGHGIPGMRERALLAGGVLTTDAAGERFVVSLRVPAVASPTGSAATGNAPAGGAPTTRESA